MDSYGKNYTVNFDVDIDAGDSDIDSVLPILLAQMNKGASSSLCNCSQDIPRQYIPHSYSVIHCIF